MKQSNEHQLWINKLKFLRRQDTYVSPTLRSSGRPASLRIPCNSSQNCSHNSSKVWSTVRVFTVSKRSPEVVFCNPLTGSSSSFSSAHFKNCHIIIRHWQIPAAAAAGPQVCANKMKINLNQIRKSIRTLDACSSRVVVIEIQCVQVMKIHTIFNMGGTKDTLREKQLDFASSSRKLKSDPRSHF